MSTMTKKIKSTCLHWNRDRNYGFLSNPDGDDYYVYQSEIQMRGYRELVVGKEYWFTPHENTGCPVAINVEPVSVVYRREDKVNDTIRDLLGSFSREECHQIGEALFEV